MNWIDTPYNGFSFRDRCRSLFRIGYGPGEMIVRALIVLFIMRTCADPHEHIYIGPLTWAGIIAFIFFYL